MFGFYDNFLFLSPRIFNRKFIRYRLKFYLYKFLLKRVDFSKLLLFLLCNYKINSNNLNKFKMKKLVTLMALALLSVSMNVNAQEKKPKAKKESTTKESKSCDKEKKAGCCAKMADKK